MCVADVPGSSLRNVGVCPFNIEALRYPDRVRREAIMVRDLIAAVQLNLSKQIKSLVHLVLFDLRGHGMPNIRSDVTKFT